MNELNVLKRICRHLFLAVLLCAVSAATASAQVPTVTVDAKNVTIKELLQRIEANSQYTFAYIDADINPDKRVSVKAVNRSIASIIAEVLPNVNMEVKGLKIVLTAKRGGESQTRPAADAGRTVKGRVTDESGAPVIGATVILKGTTVGTATNATGEYAIDIRQADAVLVYSLIGYNKVEVALSEGQTQADVTLKSEAIAMDNVVVVGYGVQNKRDVTTAISSIKAEDFAAMPTADFRDAMAAKMPGVQVLTLGGQPDGNVSIRIRGIQSATSGNDPLYVIDGVPCDARAFSNLESSDIESLEVLKDASAAAIYGSRGSCGVILITTKRGEGERPVVSYDGQFSVSNVSKTIDMLNAYEFAKIFKEARDGAYLFNVPTGSIDDPYEDRPQTYHRVDPLITAYLQDKTGTMTDTDWQDAIFRTAYSTKHSVSVSGRTKTLGYYIGANYLYREGTILGSDFERYSLRANIDGKRNRLKYGVSFSPSYSKTNYISSDTQYGSDGVIASALMAPPVFPVYNADGSYNWDMNGFLRVNSWDTQTNEVLNPVALALEIDDVREKINILGNAYVSYEFIKGLEYKFTAGGDYYSYIRNYYRPSYIPLRGLKYLDAPSDPKAQNNMQSYFHWTISNQLSFNRTFGDHSVNAVAVYEAEKQSIQTSQIVGTGTAGDDKIRTTKGKTIDLAETYNNKYAYTFASWLVRAQYSYKGRYMVSASIRGDGSSRFARKSRWGLFPSVSAGWRISQEAFMQDSGIDNLKLRASWGKLGNHAIGNYEYQATYASGYLYSFGGKQSPGIVASLSNNLLEWETTTSTNVGLELGVLHNRLSFEMDYYNKVTDGILYQAPIFATIGQKSAPNQNLCEVTNNGLELTLGWRDRVKDFSYGISANFTRNWNEVTKYKGRLQAGWVTGEDGTRVYDTNLGDVTTAVGTTRRVMEGKLINEFYLLDTYKGNGSYCFGDGSVNPQGGPRDGMIRTEQDMEWARAMIAAGNTFLPNQTIGKKGIWYGDYLYADTNGEGIYGKENEYTFQDVSMTPKYY